MSETKLQVTRKHVLTILLIVRTRDQYLLSLVRFCTLTWPINMVEKAASCEPQYARIPAPKKKTITQTWSYVIRKHRCFIWNPSGVIALLSANNCLSSQDCAATSKT